MMLKRILAGFVSVALVAGAAAMAQTGKTGRPIKPNVGGVPNLEIFRLADRGNLKNLSNGAFLFRLARERHTGVVYWAYMGTTRHVIATVPDSRLLADDGAARAILLRIADLPARVGCGVGLIHQSYVYVVPEDAKFGERRYRPDVAPLYAMGEVRNDTSGRTPTRLLSFKNFVAGN